MFSFTPEQILVVSVLSVWFLFPLGMLVSFIRQSNEAHASKVTRVMTAGDIAHSAAYAPDPEDDDEEFEPTPITAYQIPKKNPISNDYQPRL